MINEKIKTLIFIDNMWAFAVGLLGPLFAVFTSAVGGDVLDITSAWAAYLFVGGFVVIIAGKFSDNFGKAKLIIAGYFINAAFTFAYLFVQTPVQLIYVEAWLGLAAALTAPTWDALYAQYGSRKKSGFEWGLADGLPGIVEGCAVVMGGVIVAYFSFATLFIVMGIVQTAAALYTLKLLKYEKKRSRGRK